LRPRTFDFTGTLLPYSFHQAVSAAIVGPSPRAFGVISYSTRGGTSAKTVRDTRPSVQAAAEHRICLIEWRST
jgi:hypothetical protein